jgi:hypothetical protein
VKKKSAGDAESRVGLLSSVKIFGFGARGIAECNPNASAFSNEQQQNMAAIIMCTLSSC